MTTLLPPNATDFERSQESVTNAIETISTPLPELWQPYTCPAHCLPWLAWAFSVDPWQYDWPEITKRQVIAESMAIHRLKGTRAGVERAIVALGLTIELTEWWQKIPKGVPHTFELTAWVNSNRNDKTQLTPCAYQQLAKVVQRTKPVRSQYAMKLAGQSATTLGMGLVAQRKAIKTINGHCDRRYPIIKGHTLGITIMGQATAMLSVSGICERNTNSAQQVPAVVIMCWLTPMSR